MSRFPSLRLENAILVPSGDQAGCRVVARTHAEAPKAPTVRIHHVQVAAPGAFRREGQPASIGRPSRGLVRGGVEREPLQVGAIWPDRIDFVVAVAVRVECDEALTVLGPRRPTPVWSPPRQPIRIRVPQVLCYRAYPTPFSTRHYASSHSARRPMRRPDVDRAANLSASDGHGNTRYIQFAGRMAKAM